MGTLPRATCLSPAVAIVAIKTSGDCEEFQLLVSLQFV